MSEERVTEYLARMRDATAFACSYVEGMDKPAFTADTRTQQAVIMNLVIIGELSTRLTRDHTTFTAAHPLIPWTSMRGMRNRIAHGYFEINLDVVWDTVRIALPELHEQLSRILAESQP